MKRIFTGFLVLLLLISCAACAKEPASTETTIPNFSETLSEGTQAYLDVVAMTPVGSNGQILLDNDASVLVNCTLESGGNALLCMQKQEYVSKFNKKANKDDFFFTAQNITFKEPVRILGTVVSLPNQQGASADRTMVLKFTSVVTEGLSSISEFVSRETEFSPNCQVNTPVFAQIISVTPEDSGDDELMCTCQTETGDSIQIAVTWDDYMLYFRPYNADASNKIPRPVYFVQPVTIRGLTVSGQTEGTVAMLFKEADIVALSKANASRQPPQPFTQDILCTSPVYTEISHIIPQYMITSKSIFTPMPTLDALLCKCTLKDGSGYVWVYMDPDDYIAYFENDAYYDVVNSNFVCDGVYYIGGGKRITGVVDQGKYLHDSLPADLQTQMIIKYEAET